MKLLLAKMVRVVLLLVVATQQCGALAHASADKWLRPAAHNSIADSHELGQHLRTSFGGSAASEHEIVLHGTSLDANATIFGRAAIVSATFTTKILRGVDAENAAKELYKLDVLHYAMMLDIDDAEEDERNRPLSETDKVFMKQKLLGYYEQGKRYYQEHHQERVIHEAAAVIDFLIDRDKDLAFKIEKKEEGGLLAALQWLLEQHLCYTQPLVEDMPAQDERTQEQSNELNRRAQKEWERAVNAGARIQAMYTHLEEDQRAEQQKLMAQIAALEQRVLAIESMPNASDSLEQQERSNRAKKHVLAIAEMKKVLQQSREQESKYMLAGMMVDDAVRRGVVSAEHLAGLNTTATARIYNKYIRPFERKLAHMDKSNLIYTKMMEGLRTAQDLVGHLNDIEHVRLAHIAGTDGVVLFTDHEIGVPALLQLLSSHNIVAIVTTAGNIGTHWIVVATGKGVPVVMLNAETVSGSSLDNLVEIGDEIIIELQPGEQASSIIIRPGQQAKLIHELAARKNQLEDRFFLQEAIKSRFGSQGMPVHVYANMAEAAESGAVLSSGGEGVGLFRTEIALDRHNTMLRSYIESVKSGTGLAQQQAYLDSFYYQYASDMLALFHDMAGFEGPFTIRTFDIEPDKAKSILEAMPEGQRKSGLEFYKTQIGGDVLIAQLSAIMNAYYIFTSRDDDNMTAERKALLRPNIIFPMVKTADDTSFALNDMLEKAIAKAKHKISLEQVTNHTSAGLATRLSFEHVMEKVQFGIMGETLEAISNINTILQNPRLNKLSIGTNDLTQAGLSRLFNIRVSRDDPYFGKLFFELMPSTLSDIEAFVVGVSQWNQDNPGAQKTVTACGAIASRKEFLLFVAYLQQKYNVKVGISLPPHMVPALKVFRQHITPSDLEFFQEPFGFSTEKRAQEAARKINERIFSSPEYRSAVTDKLTPSVSLFENLSGLVSDSASGTTDIWRRALKNIESAA